MFKKSLLYNSENHPRFMKVFSRLLNVFFPFPTLHSDWSLNGTIQQKELNGINLLPSASNW